MNLAKLIFGTTSKKEIKKIIKTIDKIESLESIFEDYSDLELLKKTDDFKNRFKNGETLNQLLPEAYAVVREASKRVLGKRPFRVQLICGMILHQGRIAEMKTGEGKTLSATFPAYLNAIAGNGVHIVTVNEYLAKIGAEEMGRIYSFLGLTTGLILQNQSKEEKKKAYDCDITYGTNNEFGFDYLRDNMAVYKEGIVQRGHHFAIIDEVDSILIDEARTPLIISGEGEKSTDIYINADKFVSRLKQFRIKEIDDKSSTDFVEADPNADYIVDEKKRTAVLTANGIDKFEKYFNVDNYADPDNSEIVHCVNQSLYAHGVLKKDVDYVIKDNQILIVDSFTGRIMPGRRWSNGVHQAVEAKEHVVINKENKTLATITFQNYFRMYKKLSGMTGTAVTEEDEFKEIYYLDVVEIPTNKPMIRIDHPDSVYKTAKGKYDAIVEKVLECKKKGQPVLIGTVSVEKSEFLSKKLALNGIKHTVLNAKYHEKEAEIVAMAGKLGTVTIATNMAGRGTDIMLGGNPEFLAKQEMKSLGYDDEIIGDAAGSSYTENKQIIDARGVFKNLFNKYKEQIQPEYEAVCKAGGLFIIGTERHESRRIDNQLRGRSGRQGDPGESKFYLSLEDDLLRLFGSERIIGLVDRLGLPDNQPIDAKILSNTIENAQKRLEDQNFNRRKNVLSYDDVMNQQRNVIYNERNQVLDCQNIKDKILTMISNTINIVVDEYCPADNKEEWSLDSLRNYFLGYLCSPDDFKYDNIPDELTIDYIKEYLNSKALEIYSDKEKEFGEAFREIERIVLLRNVDTYWTEHIDVMDDLKESIGLSSYAQKDPLNQYRIASADLFDEMINNIQQSTARMILSVKKSNDNIRRKEVNHVKSYNNEQRPVINNSKIKKVGPNDLCPCGSGKKYKKCHGIINER